MEAFSMRLLPLFDWLLWTTIQAAVLFCLIMLVQFILRSRLPVRWHYCLWLLLLIRLAIPWLPESKISVFNLVPRSIQQGGILESYSKPHSTYGMGFYRYSRPKNEAEKQQEGDTKNFFIRLVRMMPLLWLLGTVVLAVYVGAGNFRLWWLVTRERPLTDQKILDLLEDCKSEMGIRTILGVVMTDKVKSPALFGFIRPRLLLPAGMIETLSREEMRYIFLHELGHLRRRDIYIGWLMSLLQVLHWFNPLVWLAFYRMQTDRELACDALVLARLSYGGLTHTHSGESKEYGRTIVNLLERFSRPQRLPSMAGILETKSQLKRRIKMIAKFKKTSRPRWAGAMLLLAALGCIVLTNAYVAKADFTFGTPINLGPNVNGTAGEYGPSVSADGLSLYFSSNRTGGSGGWDIWVATRATTNTDWSAPVNLGAIVNTTADEGRPSISADGLSLFYETNRSGGSGDWDIWVTTRATTEHEWGTPVNLGPTVNSWTVDSGPSISADGLSLFFESGRTGLGLGDIWVTRRATITGPWEPPVNLGSPVNTSDFDVQPSISADGMTLFFTSNRSGNMNLWVTTRADISDPWATPVDLGSIVNSAADDVFPCIAADGKTLYFNSSRSGGVGSYDLWQASILPVVDLNGDGKVDIKDLRKLAQYWGQDEPSCDIAPLPSGDGIVDNQDLMVLAEYLLKELLPIAHWKLDETEGDIAQDSVGKNNGTLHGNPAWQPADGAVDGVLQFDGADDYISTDFILNPVKGSFSMFVWIKGGEPGQVIISQKDTTERRTTKPGSEWLWADSSNGRLITALMHPLFDPLVSESVITDNRWHHVGLVYDFDALKRSLYVDGAEVAKDTNFVAGISSEGGLIIGAGKYLNAGSFFSGLIDDIRIYDEVLSLEEIADLAR